MFFLIWINIYLVKVTKNYDFSIKCIEKSISECNNLYKNNSYFIFMKYKRGYTILGYINSVMRYLAAFGMSSYLTLAGCGENGGQKVDNAPPALGFNRRFSRELGDEGRVFYEFFGSDADGKVSLLKVTYNDITQLFQVESEPNGRLILPNGPDGEYVRTIKMRNNTLKVRVFDEQGAPSDIAFDRFIIMTEAGAVRKIRDILNANKERYKSLEGTLDNPAEINIPGRGIIHVDFLIRRLDDRRAVINYSDLDERIIDGIEDRRLLRDQRIHALYLFRLPEREVEEFTKEFVADNFRDPDIDRDREPD